MKPDQHEALSLLAAQLGTKFGHGTVQEIIQRIMFAAAKLKVHPGTAMDLIDEVLQHRQSDCE